jgi:hypothetical protein
MAIRTIIATANGAWMNMTLELDDFSQRLNPALHI